MKRKLLQKYIIVIKISLSGAMLTNNWKVYLNSHLVFKEAYLLNALVDN